MAVEREKTSSTSNKVPSQLAPVRLGQSLRACVRAAWDRLGLVVAMSLTWTVLLTCVLTLWRFLPHALPTLARNLTALIVAALILSAPTAGACYVVHRLCTFEEVAYTDFWQGARRLFAPATRLGLFHTAVALVATVNVGFYLALRSPFGLVAALVCLYILLFWGMMAVYHFPLLVAQEMGVFDEPERPAKRGVRAALRRAFYLALGDPFPTFGLLALLTLLTVAMFLLAIPFALLWLGTSAFLATYATRALLVKYGVLSPPPPEEPIPDEKFKFNLRQD